MKSFRYGELIIGAIVGVIIMFACYFFILHASIKYDNQNDEKYPLQTTAKIDSIQVGNYNIHIKEKNEVEIKEHDELIDEKIKSFNDRLGDIYLSFGIIIALLLAIVAGVYFKTETEVAKHMHKNFGQYKNEIETMNGEAQKFLNEIKSKADLAAQVSIKRTNATTDAPGQNSSQPIPPQSNDVLIHTQNDGD